MYVDVRDNARDLASALGAPARQGGRLFRLLLLILVQLMTSHILPIFSA